MNKPPEKVMEGKPGQRIVYIGNGFLPSYEDFQRAFILEEKEPMEKKTENLTVQEAWAAMARGECVKAEHRSVHRIKGAFLQYYHDQDNGWQPTNSIIDASHRIVPDPSRPKEVEDEYERDRKELILNFCRYNAPGVNEDHLIEFIEKYFQRKP